MPFAWTSIRQWSLRVRLTFLYLIIFGFTLVLFCSLLYKNFADHQQNEFDIALYNHAVDIAQGIRVGPFGNFAISSDILSTGGKIFPFAAGSAFVQIQNLDGTEIGRSRNLGNVHLPWSQKDSQLLFQTRGVFETRTAQELKLPIRKNSPKTYRMLTALSPGQSSRNFILQVAVPDIWLSQVTRDLKQFLWIGIPLTLILATFGGFYLSAEALAPVRAMIRKANSLSPESLSERIPVPPSQDELRSLALTLNELLERLQHAFESQERFIADASHELKTPLAVLRGELEVFRSRPRNEEETRHFLDSTHHELHHLSRVVEDLLILARVDAGSSILAKSPVGLEEIVLDVISQLEPLARRKEVKIRFLIQDREDSGSAVESSFSIHADADLLRILIKNLIENAIKFSPEGKIIEVNLHSASELLKLQIANSGPGIPKEIQSKIFQRFYRGPGPISHESAAFSPGLKTQVFAGAGLGLAIAHRIAQIHGGQIVVDSAPDSITTFTLQIKKL